MHFGVASTKDLSGFTGYTDSKTCAAYNNGACDIGQANKFIVRVDPNGCNTNPGDVVGVVVNRISDEFLFYKNGILVAKGIAKPSAFKKMYAVVYLFYDGMRVTVCDKYNFYELKG
jgi:hypothetical protein